MTNKLARGFDTVLMRYLPQLLCFEVKPSSVYAKSDYMRLLVNSSVLNAYAEGMSNVSNKAGAMVPNADTALLYFKTIDRHGLQSAVSMVSGLDFHCGSIARLRWLNARECIPDSLGLSSSEAQNSC